MREVIRVAQSAGFAVDDLRIRARDRGWSEPEASGGFRVVFVRHGLFGLRLRGWEAVVDPVTAFVGRPGDEQSIAHRPHREDACTVLTLGERLADETLPRGRPAHRPIRTSGPVDLAHRAMLASARRGADEFELSERVVRLVDQLLGQADVPEPRGSSPSRRRLAEAAQDALVGDPALTSLDRLARHLGASRSHLSRVFRQETGESLTRFRNRVRVRAALDRLEAGEPDLARLAADLGFADHAHLTRAVRAEVGSPPSQVRALLTG